MPRMYPFLSFNSDVDWKHVNKNALASLNRLGAHLHQTITVTSGYRSYEEQAYLYNHREQLGLVAGVSVAKPGQSQHEKGLAIDALIGGKPITSVVSSRMLSKYGFRGIGSRDAVHINYVGKGAAPVTSPAQTQPAAAATVTPATVPQESLAPATPGGVGANQGAQLLAPGSVPADGFSPRYVAQLWQQVAPQSPQGQLYAQLAGGAGGNENG